jgi:predicted nucleotidyltransferase/DNA-binding XRE family transcriptional regulator
VSSSSLEPFRRALAAARQASSLTQAGLAARLGTTQSAIARLERGEVAPSITTLSRLADALGIQFEVAPRSGIIIRDTLPTLSLSSLRARRNELLAIAARHGARNVRVFGSVARGDARPDSDVDFMVELEPGRTVLDLSDLILDLEDTLGRKVDVVEVRRPSRAAEGIRHESVPL